MTPKSKLTSIDTFLGGVRQDSLAQRWATSFFFFLSREAKCSQAFLAFHSMLGAATMSFIYLMLAVVGTRQNQIDGIHVERQRGRCFACSDAFSSEIHLDLRIEGKLWNREMNAKWFYVIFLIHFFGELGFPWHPWIHATVYLVNYLINGCNIVGCIWYQLCIYVNRVGLQNISERFWNIIVLQSVGIVWS